MRQDGGPGCPAGRAGHFRYHTIPGMINVDFADIKAIMADQGTALMGIGHASGEQRAVHAAEMACASPLLETTIDGARGVLINVTGGPDLTLTEVYEAADIVYKACDSENVNVIFGTVIDPEMQNEVKITVLATGFDVVERQQQQAVEVRAAVAAHGEFAPPKPSPAVATHDAALIPEGELDIPAFLRRR